MGFDFSKFDEEKKKIPLSKQQGTLFNPSEEDNKSTTSSNTKPRDSRKSSTRNKVLKPVKLTQQEKKKLEKKDDLKKFKGQLGINSSDLIIDYMDKTIQGLEDLLDVLKARRAEAEQILRNKNV